MPDWKKIKAEYIAGGTSYRKLAEKYSVSFSTIRKIAAKEKWTDLRNIAGAERDTEIAVGIGKNEARTAVTIDSVADVLLERIKEGIASGVLVSNSRTIKETTSALRDIKEIKGVKSDADAREQEARIEKLRHEVKADADKLKTVEVIVKGKAKDYTV